jgi:hypothetical protein
MDAATVQAMIRQIRDGKIARESIYVTEGFDAPDWRARWRSAP